MGLEKDSLKIYELFSKEKDNNFYAIHTLNKLYLDIYKDRINNLKEIKKYLSDFSIHPYLMLENLDNNKESEIIKLISQSICESWKNEKFNLEILKRLENPSKDEKFMKNLLSIITSEKNNERFHEKKKAKKLFYLYAEKEHIPLIMKELELNASLYNRFGQPGDSLDD
jgi:hypothetical protein